MIDLRTWVVAAKPGARLDVVCDCGGHPECPACDGDGTRVALTYYAPTADGALVPQRFDALLLFKLPTGEIEAKGWVAGQRIVTAKLSWEPTAGRVSPGP